MKNLRLERLGYFPKVTELTNGTAGIQTLFSQTDSWESNLVFSDSEFLTDRIPASDMKTSPANPLTELQEENHLWP